MSAGRPLWHVHLCLTGGTCRLLLASRVCTEGGDVTVAVHGQEGELRYSHGEIQHIDIQLLTMPGREHVAAGSPPGGR